MSVKSGLIYVGDPLCSWCYGFSNELEKIKEHYKGELFFSVVFGGLRPYTKEPMKADDKKMLKHHWEAVNERTNMPFGYDILKPESEFIYDTEKPSRAIAAIRQLKPDDTLAFFKDVQTAFYRDNIDTNVAENYFPLIANYGIDEKEFLELFESEQMKAQTLSDFQWAQQVGAKSFPTLAFQHNNQLYAVAIGYRTFDEVKKVVDDILSKKQVTS